MTWLLVAILAAGSLSPAAPHSTPDEKYLQKGVQLQKEGRYAEAEAAYIAALHEMEQRLGPEQPAAAGILDNLGSAQIAKHDYTAARSTFFCSLAMSEKALGAEHPKVGLILGNIAMIDHLQGRFAAAEAGYRRAFDILKKTLGPNHPHTTRIELGMAKLLFLERRNTEAEGLFEKALLVFDDAPDRHDQLAMALTGLAEAYRTDGRFTKAEPLYRRMLALVEERPNVSTDDVGRGLHHFAEMLRKMKRKSEARELEVQLKTMLPR